ncbi:CvpA family protein [Paenibacillus lutrae]|uniref:CvpA family protein n=1 Tax=Paenibacillus lutrae TaxID=2078573 RepID=A0A7X3JYH9_9BACL|nr:CvpA family protein [Paenibacillus lutrae]MVO98940.1 CvpA family protein [Paenibacillus lutrae]
MALPPWNVLDWSILVILAGGLFLGYARGLISGLVSMAGLLIALFVAARYHRPVAEYLLEWLSLSSFSGYDKYEFLVKGLNLEFYIAGALAFAFLFILVKLLLGIAGRMLNLIARLPGLNLINRITGAALGGIEAFVLLVIAVHMMVILPSDYVQDMLGSSRIAPYLLDDVLEWARGIWERYT